MLSGMAAVYKQSMKRGDRMSITAALSQNAQSRGNTPALVCGSDSISWVGLDNVVHRLAGHLATNVASATIALHIRNSPALITLLLAVSRAGKEALLFDPDWPHETLKSILSRVPNALLMTHDAKLARAQSGVAVDEKCSFMALPDALGAPTTYTQLQEPDRSQAFYVGFTSGSTGLPKGYRRSHSSWLDGYAGEVEEFNLGSDDVVVVPGPMAHSLSPYAIVRALNAGATTHFFRKFGPRSIWRTIREARATVLYCVPTQLSVLLSFAESNVHENQPSVRLVMCTGSKVSPDQIPRVMRVFPNAEFVEFYGTSELGYVTIAKASENVPAASVGRAFPGVSISIRLSTGEPVEEGGSGLVYVQSPLRFMSYAYGGEGLERRVGDAFSAGDVGYLDSQGFLYLVGRDDRMVICGGKNVHPEEIEAVLLRHPLVARAAVFGMPDSLRGQFLVACLAFREAQQLTRSSLISYARERLEGYKVPRIYAAIRDWPEASSGKTHYAGLRRKVEMGEYDEVQ